MFAKNKNVVSLSFRQKNISDEREQPHDYFGARIIAKNTEGCFEIKNEILKIFADSVKRIKDYVSNPKSGYQSIHIDIDWKETPAEIQIRSEEMDKNANDLIMQNGQHYWRKYNYSFKKSWTKSRIF